MNKYQATRKIERIVGSDDVLVQQQGADVKIAWSYAPLKYSHLADISEMFGTDCIDVSTAAQYSCSGADFVELTLRGVDLD